MTQRTKGILITVIWLLCGLLSTFLMFDVVRESRDVRFGELLVCGSFFTVAGPVGLIVSGLGYLDHNLGVIIPQKGTKEER